MTSNHQLEITISHVGREGQGVGFDGDKNVYFVRGAIPGDRVKIEVIDGRRYHNANLIEIIEPSSGRVTPDCKHFLDCGGCDWLQWSYDEQLAAKEKGIAHVLSRAEVFPLATQPIQGATQRLYYRRRIQIHRKGNRLGFHRRDSHDIVAIDSCALAAPALNGELEKLRAERAPEGWSEKIELSLGDDGRVHRAGEGGSFSQVHAEQNLWLRDYVASLVHQTSGPVTALELFCGDGNLTFSYAKDGDHIVGVDSHPVAIASAQARAEQSTGAIDMKFMCARVDEGLTRSLGAAFMGRYDTLILDPPRLGIGARTLTKILGPRVKRIIYVSCSPLTFSQDIKVLSDAGFVFRSLQPIDMFPQTHHVEIVGYFVRLRPS